MLSSWWSVLLNRSGSERWWRMWSKRWTTSWSVGRRGEHVQLTGDTIPQLSPPIPHSHSIYHHHHYQRKHQQGKKQSKTHLPWGCSSGPSVMVEAIHGRFYGSEIEGDERKREEWRERDEAMSTNPWQPKESTKIKMQSSIIHAQKSINDYPETARDEQGTG